MMEKAFNRRKTILISEEQYRKLFLAETCHHPHFLDEINAKLSDEIIRHAEETAGAGSSSCMFVFNCKNEIFQDLNVNLAIEIINGEEIDNLKSYQSNIYSGVFDGEKIRNAILNMWIPFTTESYTNKDCIHSVVSHEMMHLFDDYTSQKNGMPPVSMAIETLDNNVLMKNPLVRGNKLAREIVVFLYISSTFEKKAYLAQTLNELYRVGCTWDNYREKMKNTVQYRNFRITRDNINNEISKSSHEKLVEAIRLINMLAHNTNLPNPNTNSEGQLKQKISKWIEGEYRKFMRKYGGAVLYFLENFSTTNDIVAR